MTIAFTEELSDYICDGLANGRSLISICRDKDMPSYDTVGRWIHKYPDFAASIARAREAQADYYLDKQVEFTEIATIDDYLLRKFQADNLKWVASKLKPKKYGDKVTQEQTGPDGGPIQHTHAVRYIKPDGAST